jgi:hypothetical protein
MLCVFKHGCKNVLMRWKVLHWLRFDLVIGTQRAFASWKLWEKDSDRGE